MCSDSKREKESMSHSPESHKSASCNRWDEQAVVPGYSSSSIGRHRPQRRSRTWRSEPCPRRRRAGPRMRSAGRWRDLCLSYRLSSSSFLSLYTTYLIPTISLFIKCFSYVCVCSVLVFFSKNVTDRQFFISFYTRYNMYIQKDTPLLKNVKRKFYFYFSQSHIGIYSFYNYYSIKIEFRLWYMKQKSKILTL